MAPWVFDPHSGGVKIPDPLRRTTEQRLLAHAAARYAGRYTRLDLRFKGAFCYVDAYTEPHVPPGRWTDPTETREQHVERLRNTPTHLCRLRHIGLDRWSVAFFTYSHERYEPTFLASGEAFGTPEQGFDVGAMYLTD